MTDTDSYLLKCALESIENGVKADEIQELCACSMGLKTETEDELETI